MSTSTPGISQEGVSHLLSKDDFLNLTETADLLENTLDAIQEVINCRADIFMQKKEKHQQILDYQVMKLEKEKNEFLKKSEAIMNEMGKRKSNLMQIEHSYFNFKNKLNTEVQTNKILRDKINLLQLDGKQKNAKFDKTAELYSVVINLYKEYLNLDISLDKENYNLVTVSFKGNKKEFENSPTIKLEVLEDGNFKILKLHPSLKENNDDIKNIIGKHQVILLLQKLRNYCITSC